MLTVWERRRLKRETLEPEEMQTAGRGGWVSTCQVCAWLELWLCQAKRRQVLVTGVTSPAGTSTLPAAFLCMRVPAQLGFSKVQVKPMVWGAHWHQGITHCGG